jgi:hypothetical protein
MATVFKLYVGYHLIATLKEKTTSKQFYTFETWPHEAKTYVNSIFMFFIDHTSV